ncbi:MAG: hypothetical protein MJK15_14635 [Colwellia sp.]|nr:hypothetical protein [Colwellia sp.]
MNKYFLTLILLFLNACSDAEDAHFKKIVSCDLLAAHVDHMKNEKAVYEAEKKAHFQTTKTAEEFAKLELELKAKVVQNEECKSYIKQHGRR